MWTARSDNKGSATSTTPAAMFRSIVNTLNRHSGKQTAGLGADAIGQEASRMTASGEPDGGTRAANKGNGRLIGRKSRKRLTAIVGRLQSGGKAAAGRAASQQEQTEDTGCRRRLDEDSDDEYKSAEEACRTWAPDDTSDTVVWPQSDSIEGLLPEEQCDIPTFLHTKNCDRRLIDETRRLLKERYAKNADSFYDTDYRRMLTDDWTVSRFLLRRRLEPKRAAKLMEECGRFRKQYKMSEVKLWEFPMEFHRAGGLFKYAPDRVGNLTLYMRVKMYRRVPEISDVFKAFILCVLEECDRENNGRGTAIIFDLSGCGLQNVDLGFLSWLLSSFRNYCPKGVSYILVYNLPWILNATCKLAMTWMSASNRRALRFVYGDEIENFIAKENLPDYCGGTSKINYRAIPDGSRPAIEVCDRLDMTKEQALKIRDLFKEYLDDDAPEDARSHYDDAKLPDDCVQLTSANNNGNGSRNGHSNRDRNNLTTQGPTVTDLAHNLENPRKPVVDLVSQASKFIAQ